MDETVATVPLDVESSTKPDFDVVIVGGGFGGFYAARSLERAFHHDSLRRVLLVALDNYFLFSPLLAEAASGTIEPRHAVIPLRSQLRSTTIVVGSVESIDIAAKRLTVADRLGKVTTVAYSSLVLAPGSVPSTLSIPGLAENAVSFKSLSDAIWLRNRVLGQLETAEATPSAQARRALLTFTFIGGGYAGVEALAELESLAMAAIRSYHLVTPGDMRWVLVEATDTLLPGLNPRLAAYTERQLRQRGIELHLSTRLTSCEDSVVTLDTKEVEPFHSSTIVWTTGQRPSPLLASLGLPLDRSGRVIVNDHLRVEGVPDVYAIGDAAAVPDPSGGLAPATAQHAVREGTLAGTNAAADHGVGKAGPFRYRNRGLAVTLGNGRGTAQVFGATFTGPLAWWMGRTYHLIMMPGFARRARIVADWSIGAIFPRDTAELGSLGAPTPLPPPR